MPLAKFAFGTFAFGVATLAYSLWEAHQFTVRHVTVPVLPRATEPLKVLHLSDTHMMPGQKDKQAWLRSLAMLEPDLVVNTGDNLAHRDAVPSVLAAYGDLLDLPGVFVFGSNDYFSPQAKNPLRYLVGGTGIEARGPSLRHPDLPFEELRRALTRHGWKDLSNRHDQLELAGRKLSFVGVDDPHLRYDQLDHAVADSTADLAIGVTHAPYVRVLDRWNGLGYRLILAGHTHGGQLRIPGFGALVTNCDLERKLARGLHPYAADDHEPSWLHVSAGIGTSPFTPVRLACRPEATLLTLTSAD